MKLYSFELPGTEACAVFASFAAQPYALFLDSADRAHPDARYSFILFHPLETIEAKDGKITITNPRQQTSFTGDPFKIVEERLQDHSFSKELTEGLPPFQGGAAGMFGYELARGIERLPEHGQHNPDMPDMAVGIYDKIIAFDHGQEKAWIIVQAEGDAEAEKKYAYTAGLMKDTEEAFVPGEPVEWRSNFTRESYKDAVARVIEYIYEGDIFQANLAQKFEADLPEGFDPYTHYMNLRAVNPAPFAAYMNLGNIKIASASPERFLQVRQEKVVTKPIKGTKPRGTNPAEDSKYRAELERSEKDKAENTMIVDLLRNDLSKTCEKESVNVEKLCAIESFASVHHMVSTISAALKAEHSALDLLRACFPGGSITGAPKVRAMEIISAMENTRRGPYCGALGYIGADGGMDMNILIRTLAYEGNTVSFHAGGGITAESNPGAEYQETLDKAERIFRSFDSSFPAKAGTLTDSPKIPAFAGKEV
ncbi:MAG: aminodeoxychorismate synthase component I [Alphaproteobacteria bacterium]|nr:aminodeoxychorismate synthase component I [Alphaproteobacteria bacterium]